MIRLITVAAIAMAAATSAQAMSPVPLHQPGRHDHASRLLVWSLSDTS